MSAKVEKQTAGKSISRVRQLEAELQNVKAELQETIERYEALTEDARPPEERLRKSEERFRSYFELGLIGMAITSPTKGVLEVNEEICKILGYERGELLKMNWAEMTHPEDLAADVVQFNRVIAGEIDGYKLDKRWNRRDGQIVDTTISVRALRRVDGSVDHFVALLEDITERRRAEKVLQEAHDESEKRAERRTAELIRTNTLLREADENVEMILDSITDKFFALDSEWRIAALNKHAEEQLEALGKNPAGIIGKSLWDEFPNQPLEGALRRAMNERAAIVHEHYHPLLEEWIENRIYPSKDGGLAVFQRYVTARKQAEEERAQLLRQLIFAQEDERRRVAQDLHDEMGQYLSALALGLDSLKTLLSKAAQSPSDAIVPSSAITQIERLEKIAREVDREVDRLTFELRPPTLDRLGLLAALRQYVENWSQITGIEIDFSSTGMENIRLSTEIETTIYRVAQEALTNAAKHARASHASVTLQHTHNRHIRLVIEDDGRGFDNDKVKAAPDARRKLGLVGMRERLAQVGGAFEIESAEGKGTAVFVSVPLQSKDEG